MSKSSTNANNQRVRNSTNCFNESLRLKDKMILEQAQEIAALKQKLLRIEESYQDLQKKVAPKKLNSAEADLVTAFCSIKLSCNMNVKSVMSFGIEMVGFGAKRQNIRDSLNMQHFRSHFGVGPEAIVAILKDLPNEQNEQEQKNSNT
jgi:hypothetical protein